MSEADPARSSSVWFGAAGLLLALGCGGTDTVPMGGGGDAGAGTAPDASNVDAGICAEPPGFGCREACGSDVMRPPSCDPVTGWACPDTSIPDDEIDTRCLGDLTGPCDNGTCGAGQVCGDDDRCWVSCDPSLASFACRAGPATCYGDVSTEIACTPPAVPRGCPAGAIQETACTAIAPGC